jgi:RNA polymerase sigma factor (sigma-70 family)
MSVDPISPLPSRPSPGAAGARLGQLYTEHSRMVYGVCRMLLRDPNEAEDATQQVFLSAYRNLLTGTEVRDPAAWLGTIARNACRRRATARMREPLALADDPTRISSGMAETASVEETALGREEAAELYAELAVLPQKQREAIVLRDFYGLRYDEVAIALGTSRPAVEALLFRARRRLQRRLRPGLVAGVLVVPLAVQESIAYAVPGFASTAATPAAAAAAAAGVPLIAKLAAATAAVGIAGSAGVVAERNLHDPPTRPAGSTVERVVPVAAKQAPHQSKLLAVPAGGFPAVRQQGGGGGGTGDNGGGESAVVSGAASDHDDRSEADNEGPGANDGPGNRDDERDDVRAEDDRHDNSGPGGGEPDEPEPEIVQSDDSSGREHADAELDNSGPGGGGGDDVKADDVENE